MTRQTYSLEGISGDLEVKDGKAVFTEKDGIDYAATTVQLPGGERVPFLFSLKNLVATSSSAGPIKPGFDLGGSFTVPSYRTGLFLDPKGRGTTSAFLLAITCLAHYQLHFNSFNMLLLFCVCTTSLKTYTI